MFNIKSVVFFIFILYGGHKNTVWIICDLRYVAEVRFTNNKLFYAVKDLNSLIKITMILDVTPCSLLNVTRM